MKHKLVDIYAEKKKKGSLKEGMVSFIFENRLEIRNIPYYIDKDKRVHVGIPGISYQEKQDDGSTKERTTANFYFQKHEEWEDLKRDIEKFAIEEFEKEQLAEKDSK